METWDIYLRPESSKASSLSLQVSANKPSLSNFNEKIILNILEDLTETDGLLSGFHNGFRTRNICGYQIRLVENISVNINRMWDEASIFLDIRQAFDRVWHDSLIFKFQSLISNR